jgi:mannose-6-phosphate isomerase-like protein (cupin superfamily)
MRTLCCIVAVCLAIVARAQAFSTDSVGILSKSDNIYNKALAGDSLANGFCIVIKKEVKAHKHLYHSEHVVVLEGEGQMRLDSKNFAIKKGDVVFIPKNTVHAVKSTGTTPLKVVSIQSPRFDGSDRVFVDEKK